MADLANRQFGIVTRTQLCACGLSSSAIDRWAASGRLQRIHSGVFTAGHRALTTEGRRLAAALACGPSAGLSFTDAGAVWHFCRARGSRFHVTVPKDHVQHGQRPGIHVHESRGPLLIVVRDGIPVTSAAQTLRDLATVLSDDELEEAVDASIRTGVYDQVAVDAVCGRGRPGSARLRRVLVSRDPDVRDTKSRWERRMLRILREHGLPRPLVNQPIVALGLEPDLLWLQPRVVVEWDSWTHHRLRHQFESDRRKTARLQSAGFTVLRFTWRQTRYEPETVINAIRTALSRTVGSQTR